MNIQKKTDLYSTVWMLLLAAAACFWLLTVAFGWFDEAARHETQQLSPLSPSAEILFAMLAAALGFVTMTDFRVP